MRISLLLYAILCLVGGPSNPVECNQVQGRSHQQNSNESSFINTLFKVFRAGCEFTSVIPSHRSLGKAGGDRTGDRIAFSPNLVCIFPEDCEVAVDGHLYCIDKEGQQRPLHAHVFLYEYDGFPLDSHDYQSQALTLDEGQFHLKGEETERMDTLDFFLKVDILCHHPRRELGPMTALCQDEDLINGTNRLSLHPIEKLMREGERWIFNRIDMLITRISHLFSSKMAIPARSSITTDFSFLCSFLAFALIILLVKRKQKKIAMKIAMIYSPLCILNMALHERSRESHNPYFGKLDELCREPQVVSWMCTLFISCFRASMELITITTNLLFDFSILSIVTRGAGSFMMMFGLFLAATVPAVSCASDSGSNAGDSRRNEYGLSFWRGFCISLAVVLVLALVAVVVTVMNHKHDASRDLEAGRTTNEAREAGGQDTDFDPMVAASRRGKLDDAIDRVPIRADQHSVQFTNGRASIILNNPTEYSQRFEFEDHPSVLFSVGGNDTRSASLGASDSISVDLQLLPGALPPIDLTYVVSVADPAGTGRSAGSVAFRRTLPVAPSGQTPPSSAVATAAAAAPQREASPAVSTCRVASRQPSSRSNTGRKARKIRRKPGRKQGKTGSCGTDEQDFSCPSSESESEVGVESEESSVHVSNLPAFKKGVFSSPASPSPIPASDLLTAHQSVESSLPSSPNISSTQEDESGGVVPSCNESVRKISEDYGSQGVAAVCNARAHSAHEDGPTAATAWDIPETTPSEKSECDSINDPSMSPSNSNEMQGAARSTKQRARSSFANRRPHMDTMAPVDSRDDGEAAVEQPANKAFRRSRSLVGRRDVKGTEVPESTDLWPSPPECSIVERGGTSSHYLHNSRECDVAFMMYTKGNSSYETNRKFGVITPGGSELITITRYSKFLHAGDQFFHILFCDDDPSLPTPDRNFNANRSTVYGAHPARTHIVLKGKVVQ